MFVCSDLMGAAVRGYLSEYKKARDKITAGTMPDGTLIEEYYSNFK